MRTISDDYLAFHVHMYIPVPVYCRGNEINLFSNVSLVLFSDYRRYSRHLIVYINDQLTYKYKETLQERIQEDIKALTLVVLCK